MKVKYTPTQALTNEWLGTGNIGTVYSGNMSVTQCKAFEGRE